ncbi:MAG: glutamyl-tRNA reductase [Bacteroidota bacterium]
MAINSESKPALTKDQTQRRMSLPQLDQFCVVGINHWEATIPVREKFSMQVDQQEKLLDAAQREGLESLFIVSTCNRTEIVAEHAETHELIRLLTTYSDGSLDEFHEYGFEFTGEKAVEHLFEVATGLDSQILGDLQIIKQVKEGYEFAAERDMVGGVLHRLMQHVFRAHKRSRNETSLGHGAATTAYAGVKFATEQFEDITDRSILLVGTGKIGKVTCKNLISLGARKLTLINRSRDRAEFLADKYDLEVADYERLAQSIAESDLIIVATGAPDPIIGINDMKPAIERGGDKVMLDMSVPRNIDPAVGKLDQVKLANMDMLSDVTNEAYQKREEEVPKVKDITREECDDFKTWMDEQRVVPTIKALTDKFDHIRDEEFEFFRNKLNEEDLDKVENLTRRIVNKIAAHSIEHLRDNYEDDQITEVVEEMFKLDVNGNSQRNGSSQ